VVAYHWQGIDKHLKNLEESGIHGCCRRTVPVTWRKQLKSTGWAAN
jgi:hypothetical protein